MLHVSLKSCFEFFSLTIKYIKITTGVLTFSHMYFNMSLVSCAYLRSNRFLIMHSIFLAAVFKRSVVEQDVDQMHSAN